MINNRYRIIHEIGKGGMGIVYAAEDTARDDLLVALKIIRPGRFIANVTEYFKHEFAILSQLHHPNLEQVYDLAVLQGGLKNTIPPEYFFTCELIEGKNFFAASAFPVDKD